MTEGSRHRRKNSRLDQQSDSGGATTAIVTCRSSFKRKTSYAWRNGDRTQASCESTGGVLRAQSHGSRRTTQDSDGNSSKPGSSRLQASPACVTFRQLQRAARSADSDLRTLQACRMASGPLSHRRGPPCTSGRPQQSAAVRAGRYGSSWTGWAAWTLGRKSELSCSRHHGRGPRRTGPGIHGFNDPALSRRSSSVRLAATSRGSSSPKSV